MLMFRFFFARIFVLTAVFDYKYETILCDCQTGQMSKQAGQRHSWEERWSLE